MLFSDFAAAAVLITFGVVLGKTTPLQLIILALIEIVLFTVNEIIGRKYLKVDWKIEIFEIMLSNWIKRT